MRRILGQQMSDTGCMQKYFGVSYLKEKKVLWNAMGSAYEGYLRFSRKLTGLELKLIRGRTTADNAKLVVNQVPDSYQNWKTKAKAYYKFKPGVEDDSLKGTVLILGELVMVARDNIGFDELMEANIESSDVATIADQEVVNMDVSRKIYDRVESTNVAPVVAHQKDILIGWIDM